MQQSNIPVKFPIPFANSAGGGFTRPIPTPSQIGIQAGAASLTDGFPPTTFDTSGAGTPPFGQDFNGLLFQISGWSRWQGAGATVQYDNTFAVAVGGYPAGSIVVSTTVAGVFWYNTTDNNVNNPDTGGAGWVALQANGAAFRNSRIVTTSTPLTMLNTDCIIGFNRTASVTATSVLLPTPIAPNQEFEIQDLFGNFNSFPVTVNPPGGHTISGLTSFVLNIDHSASRFHFYSGTVWGMGT